MLTREQFVHIACSLDLSTRLGGVVLVGQDIVKSGMLRVLLHNFRELQGFSMAVEGSQSRGWAVNLPQLHRQVALR